MFSDQDRLLSRPLRVHWAGWESNTARLQQAGWSLSAEQDFALLSMRLAMRHEGQRIYGISQPISYDFFREGSFSNQMDGIALHVPTLASNFIAEFVETGLANFQAIDAMPQFLRGARKKIEDFAHFATPLTRTQEIIVPDEDVPALLARILEKQQPDRDERARRFLRAQRDGGSFGPSPRQKFHAQILSIAA